MSVYSLIGMASYSASIGYGITTAAVGIILTCTRILDGITDPLLAFVYDRVNTKFGKLRVLLVAGYLIEAAALYAMFTGFSSKGLGLPVFALLYVLYIIGYTVSNMTAQTIPAIMTNDPRPAPHPRRLDDRIQLSGADGYVDGAECCAAAQVRRHL